MEEQREPFVLSTSGERGLRCGRGWGRDCRCPVCHGPQDCHLCPCLSPSLPASLLAAHLPLSSSLLTSGLSSSHSPRSSDSLEMASPRIPVTSSRLLPACLSVSGFKFSRWESDWPGSLSVPGRRSKVAGWPELSPMTFPAVLDSRPRDKTRLRNVPSPGSQGCLLNCFC